MTDRELKRQLKKIGIAIVLIGIIMIILSVYTLGSTKAELSIYNSSEHENNLVALGIDKQEFEQYLSVFGILTNDEYKEKERILNTATYFVDTMCSVCEVKEDEAGLKYYDSNIINEVIEELNGTYIKKNIDGGKYCTYNSEMNTYVKNETECKIPYCVDITEISKTEDKIDVTYELAFMTKEQMADYMTGKDVDIETKTINAVILYNTDYMYSKYFVSSIEEK